VPGPVRHYRGDPNEQHLQQLGSAAAVGVGPAMATCRRSCSSGRSTPGGTSRTRTTGGSTSRIVTPRRVVLIRQKLWAGAATALTGARTAATVRSCRKTGGRRREGGGSQVGDLGSIARGQPRPKTAQNPVATSHTSGRAARSRRYIARGWPAHPQASQKPENPLSYSGGWRSGCRCWKRRRGHSR